MPPAANKNPFKFPLSPAFKLTDANWPQWIISMRSIFTIQEMEDMLEDATALPAKQPLGKAILMTAVQDQDIHVVDE